MKKRKRCQRCKKPTLINISKEPERINHLIMRSYVGVLCTRCNWSEKKYVFENIEEEG